MNYKLITSKTELREIFKYIKSRPDMFVAFDTETYGPLTEWVKQKSARFVWDMTAKLAGFSFAFEDKSFYVPVAHTDTNYDNEDLKRFLRAFFALPNRVWGHNLDYDFRSVRNFVGEYLIPEKFGDTMVLTWIVGAPFVRHKKEGPIEFYGLKDLVSHHFGHKMQTYDEAIGDTRVLDSGPSDEEVEHAARGALAAFRASRQLSLISDDAPPTKREQQKMERARKEARRLRKFREPQMNDLPATQVCKYACEDAYWTLQLATRFWGRLRDMGYAEQWDTLEMPRVVTLRRMHDNGFPVSKNGAKIIKEQCAAVYEPLAEEFRTLSGAIIDSPQQVAEALFNRLKVVPTEDARRTKTGALAVDYDAMQWVKNHPEATALGKKLAEIKIRHALYKKIGSTYTDSLTAQLPYSPDGLVHPRFKIVGTRTGRLSCSDPNAQNFPRPSPDLPDVRALVEAPPGHVLFAVDLSQIEIVIMAHFSKDAKLTEVILEGKSMHDITAAGLDIGRSEAKCLHPHSLLHTPDGLVRMDDVHLGNKLADNTVSHVFSPSTKEAVLVVSRYGGAVCSLDHKWPTQRGDVATRDLTAEDVLEHKFHAYPGAPQSLVHGPYVVNITKDLAYVLGAFAGDGCVSSSSVRICGGYGTPEYGLWLAALESRIRGAGFETTTKLDRNDSIFYASISFGHYKSAEPFFTQLGVVQRVDGKKQPQRVLLIPDFILNAERSTRLSYLAGLLDTDGCVTKYNSASITTKDPIFALHIGTLVQSLGHLSNVEVTFNKKYQKNYYRVHLRKTINSELRGYMSYEKKIARLTDSKQEPTVHPNTVRKIVPLGEIAGLLDIEVDSADHSFFVHGVRTKNSVNFLKNYGGGAKKLAQTLGVPLVEVEKKDGTRIKVAPDYVKGYSEKYDELYCGVTKFRETMSDFAARNGYVETILGRRRYLPNHGKLRTELSELNNRIERGLSMRRFGNWGPEKEKKLSDLLSRKRKVSIEYFHEQRVASNTPIQGSAADIMNAAMVKIDEYLRSEGDATKMILQVHDELVFIAPEERAEKDLDKIRDIMETVVQLSLPIKACGKIGKRWSDCK